MSLLVTGIEQDAPDTDAGGTLCHANAELKHVSRNQNGVSVGQKPYFKCYHTHPTLCKGVWTFITYPVFTLVLIFSPTPSDNSDEKENTTCFCLMEIHTHIHWEREVGKDACREIENDSLFMFSFLQIPFLPSQRIPG